MIIPLYSGHKEVRRSMGHIMVTTHYSNQQGSKSRQNLCEVQPTENIENLSAPRRCLWVRATVQFLPSRVLPIFQNLKYKLQIGLSDVLPIQQSHQKGYKKLFSSSRTVARRQVIYATLYKQWHRPMSKRFIRPPYSYRKQSLSTRIVVTYPRPAF